MMARWLWRHKFLSTLLAIGVMLVASGALRAPKAAHNYRDLPTLEHAVQAQEQQRAGHPASRTTCRHHTGDSYACTVSFTDGITAAYRVAVPVGGATFTATAA
jgi:hypothetical protein